MSTPPSSNGRREQARSRTLPIPRTEGFSMIDNWGHEALTLHFAHGPDAPPRLLGLNTASAGAAALPLVEIEVTGHGRSGTSGKRHVDSLASRRLRYESHEAGEDLLTVRMRDQATDLRVAAHYRLTPGLPVVTAWAEVTAGAREVRIEQVTSFVLAGVAGALGAAGRWENDVLLWSGDNPWSGEYRWKGVPLGEAGLVDVGMTRFGQTGSKNRAALTSSGAWPSSEKLPMGWLEGPAGVLAWQIEHNGSWHAEVADRFDELYLLLSGPGQREHQWSVLLAPGDTFTTVAATVAVADEREGALAALTGHRRARRRPHPDSTELPVVFNDFMNCLMGDPTTDKLLPLVRAAATAGAEYFCVDAGWFDDERGPDGVGGVPGWWDAIGEWRPAASRFPGGLAEVTDAVKAAGMIPGLWLEPEVVGVRSPIARMLPDEAFFRRDGVRITEWGRHQLDLMHPAALAHLDETVDRLVREYGIGYFKFDHNIDIGVGTDAAPHGPGHGLLAHNRATLAWLESVMERHPGLVVEGCAAGGMRVDHATLARVPVQSLTDQQDERLIAAVAAAAPAAVPPEQGAVWAYPQPGMTDAEIGFSMVSALLGRVHLSGRIDLLDDRQIGLVSAALDVYKTYRRELARAVPSWPLGLPGWRDDWLALALTTDEATLMAVWRRGGPGDCLIPMPERQPEGQTEGQTERQPERQPEGQPERQAEGIHCLYASVPVRLDPTPEGLRVGLAHPVSAVIVRIPRPSPPLS
ncbi:alpha-galactosidase [Streptomyces sp. NPDC050085]|uniref:alpha-galactosidase n=1 Tax=Streptomyces sp. NPDC050085 TaxID=3365600 RepID=UPI0037954E94